MIKYYDKIIDHNHDLPRINRIAGQLTGVKKMMEEGRYCPDILVQLRAVRAAIRGLEASILERHLGDCVTDSLSSKDPEAARIRIDEIKSIFKTYDV